MKNSLCNIIFWERVRYTMKLFLSIITINRNNVAGLERTIQSVIRQTSTNFEYIIIDGASDDGSVEMIKKHTSNIKYWISEPDTGIYNAMNKGISKAQGEYCLFLNSGDWLIAPETLENVLKEITGNLSDIFYADIKTSTDKISRYPKKLTIDYLLRKTISHQNSLIKRSLFIEHGLYNENLIVSSDWEFFLKEFWEYKSTFYHLETNIAFFELAGISSQRSIITVETAIVLKNIFNELALPLIEYTSFRRTIYYRIFAECGEPRLLKFLLKLYRFLFKACKKVNMH